jgi:hypothetical protein
MHIAHACLAFLFGVACTSKTNVEAPPSTETLRAILRRDVKTDPVPSTPAALTRSRQARRFSTSTFSLEHRRTEQNASSEDATARHCPRRW